MKRVTALTIACAIFTLAGGGLFIACGAPTEPSSVAPAGGSSPSETASVIVHDSLNPAADQSNLRGADSQAPSGEGFSYQSYDDFVSPVSASLTTVSWQGVYCIGAYTAAVPSPTATAFDVAFFADRANWPAYYADAVIPSSRVPLYEASFVIDQVHETTGGNVNTGGACGRYDSPSATAALYDYSLILPKHFDVVAGVRYWLRIQAHNPNRSVLWLWRHGKSDNGRSVLTISASPFSQQNDLAFSLR